MTPFLPAAVGIRTGSVAGVVKSLRPVLALVTIVAAVGLGGRLRRIEDASNMSHDIRLVGGFLLAIIGEKTSSQSIEVAYIKSSP